MKRILILLTLFSFVFGQKLYNVTDGQFPIKITVGGLGSNDGAIYIKDGTAADSTQITDDGTNFKVLGDNPIILGGRGATNNENLIFDFETTANGLELTSGTGITNFDFNTIDITTDVGNFTTSAVPDATGGADLGSTTLEWGDVYVGDDKKIYLGADQDFSIEYDEDGNNHTIFAGTDVNMSGKYFLNEQGRADHVANTMPAHYYRFDGVD
nr:hypothetical protein [Candidatus Brocadiales bacterium]